MNKNILGFLLIDAPHSALNNAGQDAGSRTENAIAVKAIRRGKSIYPYISGQAWRYWWRATLQSKYNWNVSPISRESKIAFTSANPFSYPDDDVFGYMRALKNKPQRETKEAKGKKKNQEKATPDAQEEPIEAQASSKEVQSKEKASGTLTRLSPLKCSPLVSVYEHVPTQDFGVMARQEGDPVPFEHQFYSTIMKGIFSLDLSNVGIFSQEAKTGYKNLDSAYVESKEIKEAISQFHAEQKGSQWILPKEERLKRIQDTISSLSYIYSTTKSSIHLTDVTPKFIILAVIQGGNHLFMNITNGTSDKPIVNLPALKQVIMDYKDILLSDIYIGRQIGFMDSLQEELLKLQKEISSDSKKLHILSPKQAIEEFTKTIGTYME